MRGLGFLFRLLLLLLVFVVLFIIIHLGLLKADFLDCGYRGVVDDVLEHVHLALLLLLLLQQGGHLLRRLHIDSEATFPRRVLLFGRILVLNPRVIPFLHNSSV